MPKELFQRVREHAFRSTSFQARQTTNLYLDERVYAAGETLGPPRAGISVERASILVFADDKPRASFAHACRYLLYDAKTGNPYRELSAELPPFVKARPQTLKPFHEPVRFVAKPKMFHVRPRFRCPVMAPRWGRYAVLFSGMSGKQPLNDMEFLYRTLLDVYDFNAEHICVLHYDGTLGSFDGPALTWPGDGTPFRIRIDGPGTQAAFEGAIAALKGKLKRNDLLLLHANQCGGWGGSAGTAELNTYPNWAGYSAGAMASALAELPPFRRFIVMMSQCHSGGFIAPIIARSPADFISVACAAKEPDSAFVSDDGNWDSFARDWIAAQAGHDPFGGSLAFNPDANLDGRIEAEEAFAYAEQIKRPYETPVFGENSISGGGVSLGEAKVWWPWWCLILRKRLETYYGELSPEEYASRLRIFQSEAVKFPGLLDRTTAHTRKMLASKAESLIASGFK
ncbi:MAG TPA: hypothetical protein VMU04_12355 [Candidatus Acidoferrum sp.]|nr:hypothetical protein [Candidatus Acidoferrum sp.]